MEASIRDLSLPANGWLYILSVIVATAVIRVIHAFVRTTERCGLLDRPFGRKTFWLYIKGFGIEEIKPSERGGGDDHLQNSLLGLFELLVYPVLMASNLPAYIGLWLGLKVAPTLGSWARARNTYQRFLIGNALVIIASYVLMRIFITS